MARSSFTKKKFCGLIVPMITPLTKDGELDEPAVRRMVDHLIAGGVEGVFVLGTTGEGPSIPLDMRVRLVHLAVDQSAGRAQVYAGIPRNVVSEAGDAARDYFRRGAAAVVAQLPGYFRLKPDEQFNYFSTLLKRISGPLVLYDIPETVHMAIDPGVIEHLRVFSNLVGIKDSSGDPDRLAALLESYAGDPGFSVLTGATSLAAFGFQHGADGFVPSAGNLNPNLCARLYAAALKGDDKLMLEIQKEIDALQADFVEDGYLGRGIARLKKRLVQKGLCTPAMMAPLMPAE